MLWARMLSFVQSGFLLGAACGRRGASPQVYKSVGLVSNHAYAIVDVRAEAGHRLIRIKNPWGKHEWKGDWSDQSPLWNPDLRRRFDVGAVTEDGVFWMAFKDFFLYFASVDVCKEQAQWEQLSIKGCFEAGNIQSTHFIELAVPDYTWMFLSVAQPGKRGAPRGHKYRDAGLLVAAHSPDDTNTLMPAAQLWSELRRISHCELLASRSDRRYLVMPYSFAAQATREAFEFSLVVYSAKPVRVRPIPCVKPALTVGLQLAIAGTSSGKELHPGVWLHTCTKGLAVHILLVNTHPTHSLSLRMDCSKSKGLLSSRRVMCTSDLVPPCSRQLIMVLVANSDNGGYQWSTGYTHMLVPPHYRIDSPPHDPPIDLDIFHAVVRL
eukprot:TRINITY_DN16013_c0_g1_i2.p1 TRINITY_DN16013_c0_g1~~TRINITY_DN16013_c0_g1_i2.p1  ORF type:complete len:380 (+),score=32.71 TRINITY_DN16013_c0_g1_i2:1393-2532(+)